MFFRQESDSTKLMKLVKIKIVFKIKILKVKS